ncbi:Holliday junction resolvase RuvX [Verrucomicrobiota bacterium]
MGCFLGIDYGAKRIGLAVSDETGQIAFPLRVLQNSGQRRVAEEINKIIAERKVDSLVLGLPISLNGSRGIAVENVERFAEVLKKHVSIPLDFWDERLSTKIAERAMIEGGLRRKRRRQCIDRATAQIILQSYLDAHARPEVQGSEVQGSGLEDNQDSV